MKEKWSLPARYFALAVALILLGILIWYARAALQLLLIAAFTAYLINPLATVLSDRTRLSHAASVNVVYFTTLVLMIAIPASLTPIFFGEFKRVVQDLLELSAQLQDLLARPVEIAGFSFHFGELAQGMSQFQSNFLSPLPQQALQLLESTSRGALSFLVVVVGVYYFLADWPRIRDWLIGLFPEDSQPEIAELYRHLRLVWMDYLRGQIVLMVIVFVIFTIAWTVIGIPGALVLGVIAGFLTLIPDVGPFLALLLAMGVALLEGSSWINLPNYWVALIVLGAYLVLINIKGLWIRPIVMARSLHMNEGLVFISIILATILWGIMGALLIVPVVASAGVIGEYLRRRIVGLPPFSAEPMFRPPVPAADETEDLQQTPQISREKENA